METGMEAKCTCATLSAQEESGNKIPVALDSSVAVKHDTVVAVSHEVDEHARKGEGGEGRGKGGWKEDRKKWREKRRRWGGEGEKEEGRGRGIGK